VCFDAGSKASFCCILTNRYKKLGDRFGPQKQLETHLFVGEVNTFETRGLLLAPPGDLISKPLGSDALEK